LGTVSILLIVVDSLVANLLEPLSAVSSIQVYGREYLTGPSGTISLTIRIQLRAE